MKYLICFMILLFLSVFCSASEDLSDISEYYGFDEMEVIKSEWGAKGLGVCDFNLDGLNDIIIVNNQKSSIDIYLQQPSIKITETSVTVSEDDRNINAVFDCMPSRYKKESIALSEKVYSLVSGDLNSDGYADIAYHAEPRGLYILLQEPAAGQEKLVWSAKKKMKVPDSKPTGRDLSCGDINNDGKNDLVLVAKDGFYAIIQESAGSLAEPVKYPCTDQIFSAEVRDINGDGVKDIVLVTVNMENPLSIRFGLGSGALGPQQDFKVDIFRSYSFNNIDSEPGDEMLAVDTVSSRLVVYKYYSNDSLDDWPVVFYPLEKSSSGNKRDMELGDINGDGYEDVLISEPGSSEILVYKQLAGEGLSKPVRFPCYSEIQSLSTADIDGDKRCEVAVLSVKEKVIGLCGYTNNRLSFPVPVELFGEPVAMELSDVDSDKSFDMAYIAKQDNKYYLRVIYDVNSVISDKKQPAAEIGNLSASIDKLEPAVELEKLKGNPESMSLVDIDQDGLMDLIVFLKYDPPIVVMQTDKRIFSVEDSKVSQSSLIGSAKSNNIAIANIDSDSGEELLVAQNNFARSLTLKNGEKWTVIDQYNAKSTDDAVSAVAAFDLEKSGQPAIFLLNSTKGQLQMLKQSDDQTYRFSKEIEVGKWENTVNFQIMPASITGDKTNNLVIFDGKKFAVIVPNPKSQFSGKMKQYLSYETKIKDGGYGAVESGDLNSDGVADIVMVENKNNHIEILTTDKNQNVIAGMRFKIYEQKSYSQSTSSSGSSVEPKEMVISDVTGDGENDLVTLIHDRIIIYPQD